MCEFAGVKKGEVCGVIGRSKVYVCVSFGEEKGEGGVEGVRRMVNKWSE